MAISKHEGHIRDGQMVTRVQNALKKRGFDPGPADGRFGDVTEHRVMEFQEANGLLADGIVGQATWEALGLGGQVPHPVRID